MITIPTDTILDVPADIQPCPYCGKKLTVGFSCWTQCDDCSWSTREVELACESEPEIGVDETDDWYDWFDTHSEVPYMFWFPAAVAVQEWVNDNYRFDVAELPAEANE